VLLQRDNISFMSVYQTTRRSISEDQPLCKEISVSILDPIDTQGNANALHFKEQSNLD
jgi:hypothetical protein